jgi:hypothetical protein
MQRDPFLARQPSVSGPKIEEMIRLMQNGIGSGPNLWNWTGREIKYNGNVIIDGHHRYIAARLAGIEPVMVVSAEPFRRTFTWDQLYVDTKRWPGGY